MFRFEVTARYPFFRPIRADLNARIEKLLAENESLRDRVIAAQEGRVQAIEHSDELRREKERLRTKLAALKQELVGEVRINEELRTRVSSLQDQVRKLEKNG